MHSVYLQWKTKETVYMKKKEQDIVRPETADGVW